MKHTAILITTLGLLLGSLQAQVNVPSFLNYQGKVTDSAGAGLGTGTPVNRKVIFRIYDSAVSVLPANRLWTEEQTATFSGGEFNVLLGNGIAATGTAAGEARPAFETVFNGALSAGTTDRYLEITVDNGDNVINASDLPITPRQRLTTNAYSFRARTADGIPLNSDLQINGTTDYGLGWYGTGRLFNGIAVNGPVLYGQGGGALGTSNGSTKTIALQWNASGVITNNVSFSGTITGNVTGNVSGNVTGSGAGLSSLNASNISTGTLGAAMGGAGTVNGLLKANGSGTVSAAVAGTDYLTPSGSGASLTSLNANNITGGSLSTSRITGALNTIQSAPTFGGDVSVNNIIAGSGHFVANTHSIFDCGPSNNFYFRSNSLGGVYAGTFTELMRLENNGNLYLAGDSLAFLNSGVIYYANTGTGSDLHFRTGTPTSASATKVIFKNSGMVGIGTTDPVARLHVKTGTGVVPNHPSWTQEAGLGISGAYDLNPAQSIPATGAGSAAFAIKCEGNMLADNAIYVASDARIKIRLRRSDSAADLALLSRIEVTDYQYKDTIAKPRTVQKKVIAQEIEKIFPQVVTKTTDVVPDIFKSAKCKDGWLELATNLKKGERVKLITVKDEESIHEVLEVTADGFRTDFKPEGDKVFVYGREVKDFRVVDYEAISMLNVSATQQIKKEKDAEVKALQAENAELRARLTALEGQDKARDRKLASIEAMLSKAQPAVHPVSLKESNGAE